MAGWHRGWQQCHSLTRLRKNPYWGTAVSLIFSGIGLLRHRRFAREFTLVALGMLFYTGPGYFTQQGQWALMLMFAKCLLQEAL